MKTELLYRKSDVREFLHMIMPRHSERRPPQQRDHAASSLNFHERRLNEKGTNLVPAPT